MADRYEYYVGQLEGDYLETFKKIQRYANVSIIGKKYKREVLSSILDTFLNAQSENKDISKVVGKDTEKFCRQCFGENPLREHILPVFEYMLPFALAWLVILAWNVFDIIVSRNAAGDKIGFFHITVNLDIPPFPGAHQSLPTFSLSASFMMIACSLPPPPTTKTFFIYTSSCK